MRRRINFRRYWGTSPRLWVCLCLILLATGTRAELVVIMHPDSAPPSLDRRSIVNIFMGRHFRLPGGGTVVPVDSQCCREEFYRGLVDKTLPEINSYWARLVFSGRASPPQQIADAKEVLELVSRNPGVIGYVERSLLDARVAVVYAFPP